MWNTQANNDPFVHKTIICKRFYSRKNKAHGLASKFSQSHDKLENYNIELKYKRKSKYKTHIHIETKECKIKAIKDKCACDMVGWMW